MITRIVKRTVIGNRSLPIFLSPRTTHFMTSYSYSTGASTPRVLKSSSFAQPIAQPEEIKKVEVPQEDLDDFNATKLIHGKTDLHIAITKRASDKLTSIAKEDDNLNTALKISVESGGCHGFQYNLNLTDLKKELDGDDDDILVFRRNDDGIAQLIMNESSLQILQDSKIDYTKELIGSSFKVVDSPYTSSACGCGASFDFDFEKLQKKLDDKDK